MKSLYEYWQDAWETIKETPTTVPARLTIDHSHVDHEQDPQVGFKPNEHYFQVRVNEMFLSNSREWFTTYVPMAFVVSEFDYGGQGQEVPFVVGPAMIEKFGKKMAEGTIFSNTRVAGLHPYRGGRLSLFVMLCRVPTGNYARKLLQMLENASGVLDFATGLAVYVKVAKALMDSVEPLFGSGDISPVIGLRKEFDPDAGDPFLPSYFALIDMPENEISADQLWVRDNQLLQGQTAAAARPFRQADYVLYSITQTSQRNDLSRLPFYPLYERVLSDAVVPEEAIWKRAKANMLTLYQTLVLSPDLTKTQADALNDQYVKEMKTKHDKAVDMSVLGAAKRKAPSAEETKLRTAVSILDM
jgi:hypothetical protein